ncbi:hypothetical protein [Archangium lansingense]|uniref:Uncharacterized protein n=1 Tax=Archangium lansingense TaxID=2995310 RepID=A0ABT4AF92_9BACT|nr:hypothetical protein [Archangium lansinium]MCY1080330.1 hypothetical protein [Archangium lansinium]
MIDTEKAQVLTHVLERAMLKAVPDDKVRDEMAFHIADVLRDFLQIGPVIDKAFEKGELSRSDVDAVLSLLLSHWPYHLKGLARLRTRMEAAPQARRKSARRK